MNKNIKNLLFKLEEYLMNQPKENICKYTALMIINLNKIFGPDILEKEEIGDFEFRLKVTLHVIDCYIKKLEKSE